MNNSIKYNFSDFTLKEYSQLIDIAKSKYLFTDYVSFDNDKRHILWRHDIDMSPEMALKTALIENEKSVRAIYFILLHSDFYNLIDQRNYDIIKEIINLGHKIELHFDPFFYKIESESDLDEKIQFEKDIIENIFGIKLTTFSFHNNTLFTLSCDKEMYGGLINTYSKNFKKVPYCSDSNGYWRYRRLRDVLESGSDYNLHVLTHEVWWQSDELLSPKQKIINCINDHGEKIYQTYSKALQRLNLINIDWNDNA